MINTLKKWYRTLSTPPIPPIKQIAFIDGDQLLINSIEIYNKYLLNDNGEVIYIRQLFSGAKPPKKVQKMANIEPLYLTGFTPGKEIVDKCIAIYMQKVLSEGYNHITVVSSDYDFIEIFRLLLIVDNRAKNVKFRMIIPKPVGRLKMLSNQVDNIEIIKL